MHDKDRLYTSANGSQECVNWNQYYSNCAPGPENPFKGAISFDNIGYAWIAIFQVISLEGWVDIMYYVMDAHSFFSFIYFILLIVIGSFFMINLWKVFTQPTLNRSATIALTLTRAVSHRIIQCGVPGG